MRILKDSWTIVKLLLLEIFHNLLSNNIFKKKQNRIILLILVIASYIVYYIFNITELGRIMVDEHLVTMDMKLLLFSSLTNMIACITGMVFLLTDTSFSLTKKMQYMIKALPFEQKSLSVAVKLFRMIICYALYLIIFAVMMLVLRLFYFNLAENLLILIYCQFVFFASYLLYYLFFKDLFYIIPKLKGLRIVALIIFLFFYIFKFRFQIDLFFSQLPLEIDAGFILVATLFLVVLSVLIGFALTRLSSTAEDDILYFRSRYICVIRHSRLHLLRVLRLSLLRDRLTLFLMAFPILFFVLTLYDTKDIYSAMETLAYLYPAIAFCALRYYNNSLESRIMNPLYRITSIKELFCTLGISLSIHLPLIVMTLLNSSFFPSLAFSMIVFQIVLIIGILFPQIKSSVNELVAVILSIIACTVAMTVFQNAYLFVPAMILVVIMEYFLLKKGGFELA